MHLSKNARKYRGVGLAGLPATQLDSTGVARDSRGLPELADAQWSLAVSPAAQLDF